LGQKGSKTDHFSRCQSLGAQKKDRLGFKAEPVWGFSLTIRWRIVGW